jgi:hypothetical protein
MRLKRLENARKALTTLVVGALVAAVAYVVSSEVAHHRAAPKFVLTADPGFSITSELFASTCTATPTAKLTPNVTRCLAVTVHNPLSVTITVTALKMTVTSVTQPTSIAGDPTCAVTMLSPPSPATLPTGFTVPGHTGTSTVDEQIKLTTEVATNQDNCKGATFHFTFSGSATYTDSTTTTLTGTHSGTSVTLTATVAPSSPTSDSFGPSGAPAHQVSFYSCATKTCTTKTPATPLATKTLATSGKPTKSATATDTVPSLSTGPHYFEAVYTGTTTGTPDFAASTSSVLSDAVVTTLPVVCQGGTFTHILNDPIFPHVVAPNGKKLGYQVFYPPFSFGRYTSFSRFPFVSLVFGTNGNDLIELGNGNYVVFGFQGRDCIVAGTGNNVVNDGTGNDGVEAGNGNNQVFLGKGNDKVLLGNGTDSVAAGNGNDLVTVGNGPRDLVTLGNGTDTVTVGTGPFDRVAVGNGGGDSVSLGTGAHDQVTVGNGSGDTVTVGTGQGDTVRVGNGNHDRLFVGSGSDTVSVGNGSTLTVRVGNGNDAITLGNGSHNSVTLGSGTDRVTIRGSYDTITAGTGTETISLGAGAHNTYAGKSETKGTCYVPAPPRSYHGSTPTGYYDDTVTNCTVRTTP